MGHAGGIATTTAPPEAFLSGMRRLAHSVCLVTTRHDGVDYGLAATSVASISVAPPTVMVSVARSSATHAAIAGAGIFCLNILTAADRAIAEQFASPARRAERFATGVWTPMPSGALALDAAAAALDCAVVEAIPYHSHTLFLGVVRMVRVAPGETEALVYHDGAYRSLDPERRPGRADRAMLRPAVADQAGCAAFITARCSVPSWRPWPISEPCR